MSKRIRHGLTLCKAPGVPVKPEKIEGPTTDLPFLGIKLDTTTMEAHFPPVYKATLIQELQEFHRFTKCTHRAFHFLIGKMSFACM